MNLEEAMSRNVSRVIMPSPYGGGGAGYPAAPIDPLELALRKSEEMVARRQQLAQLQAAGQRLSAQEQLEALRLEDEMERRASSIEETRRQRALQISGGGLGGDNPMLTMLLSELQAVRNENAARTAQLLEMVTKASQVPPPPPPPTMVETFTQLQQVYQMAQSLLPQPAQPMLPAGLQQTEQIIKFLEVNATMEQARADRALAAQRLESEAERAAAELDIERERAGALATTLREAAPMLMELFMARMGGGQPGRPPSDIVDVAPNRNGANGGGHAHGGPIQAQTACPVCGASFMAVMTGEPLPCPQCGTVLQLDPSTLQMPAPQTAPPPGAVLPQHAHGLPVPPPEGMPVTAPAAQAAGPRPIQLMI